MRTKTRRGSRTWQRGLLVAAMLLTMSIGGAGCGDDSGTNSNANANRNENTNGNTNGNTNPTPLRVTSVDPEDGAVDVALDQTVRITFSRPLDPSTVDASSLRVTAQGRDAVGRLVVDGRLVLFSPAELEADADYIVSVSADVTDATGVGLEAPFTTSFHTGSQNQDGSGPSTDEAVQGLLDPFIYVTKVDEYVLLGVDHNSAGKDLFVLDTEPTPDGSILHSRADETVRPSELKQGAAANLDDDLYDEVVYLTQSFDAASGRGGTGVVHVLDYDGTSFTTETLDADLSLPGNPTWVQYDLALGNLDDDPWAEIVVVGTSDQGDSRLWVLDDRLAGYAILRTMDILGNTDGSTWTGTLGAWVAVGNVDDDPEDEIVLLVAPVAPPGERDGTLRVINDLAEDYAALDAHEVFFSPGWEELLHPDSSGDEFGFQTDMAIADMDADGRREVVLAHRSLGGQYSSDPRLLRCYRKIEVRTFHVVNGGIELWRDGGFDDLREGTMCLGHVADDLRVYPLDVDGDGKQELLADGYLIEQGPGESEELELFDHGVSFYGASTVDAPMQFAAGDVDGDGLPDVLLLRRDGSVDAWGIHRTQTGWDMDGNPIYTYEWEQVDHQSRGGPGAQSLGLLVPANLDGDSVVLSPEEDPDAAQPSQSVKKEIVFSDDQIVALLAAPPCADGIGQATDECETGIGFSQGSSVTLGSEFSVRAGVSLGVEVETEALFITVSKFAAKVVVSVEAAVGVESTKTVTQTISRYAGFGEDLVIFYTVPQTKYTYTLTSHPDPSLVGTKIFVYVPMSPRLFAVTREYYNANNGGQRDIDENVLSVVPGDLGSYPSLAQANDILQANTALGIITPPVTVLQGTGHSEMELELSEDVTTSGRVSVSTDMESEVCGGTVCVGLQVGASVSLYAESSYSTSTVFTSSVGALDAEHFADYLYSYGLFAYLLTLERHGGKPAQTFTVVNHYVE